ncbi:MAG: monofunctional biosynthetic peptidoglycan transglycosylase [Prosthecochloris sp.]|uniref:Biosynthetic peptidoglycan transglycosylase n=1 Tax=Prosthecochloris aestuarii (strain DSM 271 / SK 413) TaxID=290512 RepID=B4S478_PROA2|nr:monofunctional biosynthetic peptidoglycan transglycosylase [Prosthecochloris aestuarii DSM 271]NEX12919.1 monofunctional biosynthetic peptidoglycan transglycosylase [Prosthecochloris sp.]
MRALLNLVLLLGLLLAADIGRYAFLPDIAALRQHDPGKTAFMRYRERQWAEEGRGALSIRQQWVPLSRISRNLQRAVVISEDDKFWDHRGFDYDAIVMAFEENIRSKTFALGASTITQQLAKNLFLSPSKNPVRKIKEALLTWRLERALSKRRILELYLNIAEWGDGVFGAEQASRHYFGKSARFLTPSQAARLAAVLPNPLKYSPSGSSRYVAQRADRIYRIMRRRGYL